MRVIFIIGLLVVGIAAFVGSRAPVIDPPDLLPAPIRHDWRGDEENDAIALVYSIYRDFLTLEERTDDATHNLLIFQLMGVMQDGNDIGPEPKIWALGYASQILQHGQLTGRQRRALQNQLLGSMLSDEFEPRIRFVASKCGREVAAVWSGRSQGLWKAIDLVETDEGVRDWLELGSGSDQE